MTDTPMMRQYREIKDQNQDAVLFFRMGDFYEMFLDDAVKLSSLLDLTLTQRQGVPMCGVPYHSATNYVRKLLSQGYKVAICEQVEGEERSKGLMRRQVVETLSPGTVLDECLLEQARNNYLLAVHFSARRQLAFAWVDLTTGEFAAQAFPVGEDAELVELVRSQLLKWGPREILIPEELRSLLAGEWTGAETVNMLPKWYFDQRGAWQALCRHFAVSSLKGLGYGENDPLLPPAAVIVGYVAENSPKLLANIVSLRRVDSQDYLQIDAATLQNLEIVANLHDGSREYTLAKIFNLAQTAMGSRCLHRWLLQPLCNRDKINARLELVQILTRQPLQQRVAARLKGGPDLERLVGRLAAERAHARDLLAVGLALCCVREVAAMVADEPRLKKMFDGCDLPRLHEAEDLLSRAINPEAPLDLNEGRLIAEGFDPELDRLRQLRDGREGILAEYLKEERARTGVETLKLKSNRLIGYFFEVGRGRKLPDDFIRRQSMAQCERFTTEKLRELEEQLSRAEQDLLAGEQRLFLELRNQMRALLAILRASATALAQLDALVALALRAAISHYVRPEIHQDLRLNIEGGRHPVVEHYLESSAFVSNDLHLDEDQRFVLLTGPNMAGKSTFLRQNALLVYLAQCGFFVPARRAQVGLVDRMFCRVGASDNLARGESTFMVEMQESARILNLASERSLVLMDEVGRGTSTDDGLALAQSISEYLLERVGSRTLFATHYHQLTQMEHARLRNFSMAVDDTLRPILFLKKVRAGAALSSYGIHVAELAGVPREVIRRAEYLLSSTEDKTENRPEAQAWAPRAENALQRELEQLDPDRLTPLEALSCLSEWKNRFATKQECDHAAPG